MTKTTMLAALFMVAATGVAQAGGQEGSLGVGAEFGLASAPVGMTGGRFGVGGPSINYDAGKFHLGGFLSIADGGGQNDTNFALGGRFYYHVHSTAMSDFGVGGTLGVVSIDTGPNRLTLLYLEPGVQIRVFLAANVALSFNVGLTIGTADASGVALTGQATGGAGIHYYFF